MSIPVQLGMFGVSSLPDMHVVSAHDRLLADGTSVFVGEHLRWNRPTSGTRNRVGATAAATPPDASQEAFDFLSPSR